MQPKTIHTLNQLNHDFYTTVGAHFDATRQTAWPGWSELLPELAQAPTPTTVVDIGCGNGRFGEFLVSTAALSAWKYIGIDANPLLLAKAREKLIDLDVPHELIGTDIIENVIGNIALPINEPVQLIVAFGFIHHIPSKELRRQWLQQVCQQLDHGGLLIIAAWQFTSDEKLLAKAVPPQQVNIENTELEPHDYILTWDNGAGALAYRYCHLVDEAEMTELTTGLPLTLQRSFRADGRNQQLNQYWVWRKN